jgi:DNA primase
VSLAATQEAKDRIRQSVDIVDLVGGYIPLRRQGRNFVGICPWHDDSRPSLQVNPDRGSWKCWVCNIGGDIFSFVMQREGVDFPAALEMLADRAGVTLPSRGGMKTKPGDPNDKRTLYEAVAWAEKQFRDFLRTSADAEVARRYFAERKLTASSLDTFHLGFAPDSWSWLMDRARGTTFAPSVLHAAGLITQNPDTGRYYDFFRNRVIFPIRDAQGRPVAIGGRVLPGDTSPAKYINSRETRLFSKNEFVYALDQARDDITKTKNVIVVEGYMDVIMCHQHGIKNVVAVLGTALGPKHISLLRRYSDRITLLLDGDKAGQRRTNEVLELFVAGEVDLRIATLPDELDPCEFLEERSAEDFCRLIDRANDAFEHAITVQTRGIDVVRDTHQANQALETLIAVLAKSPRLTNETSTTKAVRERQVIARLAREFRVEESMLRQRIGELRGRERTPRFDRAASESRPATVSAKDLQPLDVELLEILVRNADLVDVALAELSSDCFAPGPTRQILEAYQSISDRGEAPEFSRILSELEEPQLKHLLVELDERASSKEVYAHADAATRLRQLIEDVRYRFQARDRRQQMAELEQKHHADAEELEVLRRLIDQDRKRQGIPAPTDG